MTESSFLSNKCGRAINLSQLTISRVKVQAPMHCSQLAEPQSSFFTTLQGFELVFYGDSISEDWRGTSGGMPWPIGSGSADVFYKHFGSKYNAEVLAIAGMSS